MTRVDYYHDADDRLAVAARLAQKGIAAGKRMLVTVSDANQAQQLDRTLWTFSPLAFVPHALADTPLEAESPLVISQKIPANAASGYDILINLGEIQAEQTVSFSRVIEIVTREDSDKARARECYRRYREMGCEMVAHRLGQSEITQPRDVVDRIDSLVNRKRVFVAGAGTAAGNRPATEDEDIPMLTEVVDISEVSSDAPTAVAHTPIEPLLDAVTLEFAAQLQQRFTQELPALIDSATQRLKIELQQTVHRITDQAVRDFMAKRQQLPLPLPDADSPGD